MAKVRTTTLIVLLLLVLIGVSIALGRSYRPQPSWHGKSIRTWARVASYGSFAQRELAEQAALAIGTNAVPFLLQELQYEQPKWKRMFVKIVAKIPGKLGKRLQASRFCSPYEACYRRNGASWCLRWLGPAVVPALPQYEAVITNQAVKLSTRCELVYTLSFAGCGGIPLLLKTADSKDDPALARYAVGLLFELTDPCLSHNVVAWERAAESANSDLSSVAKHYLADYEATRVPELGPLGTRRWMKPEKQQNTRQTTGA